MVEKQTNEPCGQQERITLTRWGEESPVLTCAPSADRMDKRRRR
jgi:hypothetical protein